jgi:hypothetical protein
VDGRDKPGHDEKTKSFSGRLTNACGERRWNHLHSQRLVPA